MILLEQKQRSHRGILMFIIFSAIFELSLWSGLLPIAIVPPLHILLLFVFLKRIQTLTAVISILGLSLLGDIVTVGTASHRTLSAMLISMLIVLLKQYKLEPRFTFSALWYSAISVAIMVGVSGIFYGSLNLADLIGQMLAQFVALSGATLLMMPVFSIARDWGEYESLS